MDLTGVPTPKMDWEASNLPEQWKKFRTHVDLIFKGPLEEKSEEIKVTYLLLWPYGLATKVARYTTPGQV